MPPVSIRAIHTTLSHALRNSNSRSLTIISTLGGGPTDPHEYPYQVALTYYDYFFCGGSLITRQHVLTAAHCTEYMIQLNDTENFKVIIAEHDLSNENDCAHAVGVEEIIAHPAYNNTSFDGDFSILGKF